MKVMANGNQHREPSRFRSETTHTAAVTVAPPSPEDARQRPGSSFAPEDPLRAARGNKLREGQVLAGLLEETVGSTSDRPGTPTQATADKGGIDIESTISMSDRRLARRGGDRAIGFPLQSLAKLTRRFLEDAFVSLSEENARLRQQVKAAGSFWQIAHQDPLTGLWNRRYADERLAEEMSRARREGGYRFSMVLVDVDNLKRLNDDNGHASGDEALKWVARFLREGLRAHDLSCRIGGDEFLLILPGSGEQECKNLVERIQRRWQAAANASESAVSVSMGTASFPAQGSTVETLLAIADDSMYANKRRQESTRLLTAR
jgi:diguanylate cyclase (GGDEF)-like protein